MAYVTSSKALNLTASWLCEAGFSALLFKKYCSLFTSYVLHELIKLNIMYKNIVVG